LNNISVTFDHDLILNRTYPVENATVAPKRKLTMKQTYAMRARQAAEAEAKAKARAGKAARCRGFFIKRGRKLKVAQAAA
jgi:hypothetical protein